MQGIRRSGQHGPGDSATLTDLIEILGIRREQVVDAEWLDNGPGWVGLLLDSARTVLDLHPNAAAHPGKWDIGVIGAHEPHSEAAFELRAFFTEGGVPLREDPVTGSLNAAAAQWLTASDRATAPYIAAQGTATGRQERIHISSNDGKLWVGGRAEVILTGSAVL